MMSMFGFHNNRDIISVHFNVPLFGRYLTKSPACKIVIFNLKNIINLLKILQMIAHILYSYLAVRWLMFLIALCPLPPNIGSAKF
jgi:hypothetical protein